MLSLVDKIHDVTFKLLCEVDRICKKNDIRYYISSGTLLGAARHQGFIPWDDDTDIMIKRSDYIRFQEACKAELGPDFIFDDYPYGNHYPDHFVDFSPGIRYRNSRLFPEDEKHDAYNGVRLDVFILDNTYEETWKRRVHIGRLILLYGLCMGHRYHLDFDKYTGASRLVVGMLSKIGKKISLEKLTRRYVKLSTRLQNMETTYYFPNVSLPWLSHKNIYRREWFDEVEYLPINGKLFAAPKGWKQVLEVNYGDYMKLPPEEDRVFGHFDIEKSEIW